MGKYILIYVIYCALIIIFWRQVKAFQELPRPLLEMVAGKVAVATFARGAALTVQGEPADTLLVLQRGEATAFEAKDGGWREAAHTSLRLCTLFCCSFFKIQHFL